MKKHKKNSHFNSLESLNYLSKFTLLTPKSTSKFTRNDFVLCYFLFFCQKYIVSIVSACIYPLLLTNVEGIRFCKFLRRNNKNVSSCAM